MAGKVKKKSQYAAEPLSFMDHERKERLTSKEQLKKGEKPLRNQKPTREDVCKLLRDYEDKLFYFHINFNPPPRQDPEQVRCNKILKIKTRIEKTKTRLIEDFLWEKFNLYKLQSDKGKRHSLNRSLYIGIIPNEGKCM